MKKTIDQPTHQCEHWSWMKFRRIKKIMIMPVYWLGKSMVWKIWSPRAKHYSRKLDSAVSQKHHTKLRNCHNSCASSHRPIFDSDGQAWFGVGAGAGDTYIGRRLARTNAASANDYVRTESIIGAAEIRPGPWCVCFCLLSKWLHTPFGLAQTTFLFYAKKPPDLEPPFSIRTPQYILLLEL